MTYVSNRWTVDTDGSPRRPSLKAVLIGLAVLVVAGLIAGGAVALARLDHRHSVARDALCSTLNTADPAALYGYASRLDYNDSRDVNAYAADLDRFGPTSLVTQKAFDTVARDVCAS